MGSLSVEVVGKFGSKEDANKLLYAPLSTQATFRKSRVYRLEFDGSDDLARACLFLMEHYDSPEIINIGWGQDCTIRKLAEMIAETVGFTGSLKWDDSRPDGTPRKVLDNRKLTALGWEPKISLQEGLKLTYQWYLENNG